MKTKRETGYEENYYFVRSGMRLLEFESDAPRVTIYCRRNPKKGDYVHSIAITKRRVKRSAGNGRASL